MPVIFNNINLRSINRSENKYIVIKRKTLADRLYLSLRIFDLNVKVLRSANNHNAHLLISRATERSPLLSSRCTLVSSDRRDFAVAASASSFLASKDKSNGLARLYAERRDDSQKQAKGELPPSSRERNNYAKITRLQLPMTRHDDLALFALVLNFDRRIKPRKLTTKHYSEWQSPLFKVYLIHRRFICCI